MKETELKQLGFSNPEIKIYLSLLGSIGMSGSQMAKKTKMYRPYVYDTLEKLIGKGVVTYSFIEGKKKFKCAPPSALTRIIEEEKINLLDKEQTTNKLIPTLEKLYHQISPEYSVEVFEGKSGFKAYYEFILEMGSKGKIKELRSYGGGLKWFDLLKNYYPDLIKRAIESGTFKKLHYMQLWNTNLRGSKNEKTIGKYVDIRYLKGVSKKGGGVITFNDYVVLTDTQEKTQVILIRDRIIADTMKNMHSLLWKMASK